MLAQLIETLQKAQIDCTPIEIAESVLLGLLFSGDKTSSPKPKSAQLPKQEKRPATEAQTPNTKKPVSEPEKASPSKLKAGDAVLPSEEPKGDTTGSFSGIPFRTPKARALPGVAKIARDLRPFKRKHPSAYHFIIDEEATVQQIADGGAKSIVQRPFMERWLEIALVLDESISMHIWHPTLRAFRRLLERHGAFRDVQVWKLNADESEVKLYHQTTTQRKASRPGALVDPGGRRLILVVSDCTATGWYHGKAYQLLSDWAHQAPTALVQVLPRSIWYETSMIEADATMQANEPGTINSYLRVQPETYFKWLRDGGVAVPVITLDEWSIAPWAKMLAGVSQATAVGMVIPNLTKAMKDASPSVQQSQPQEFKASALVNKFHSSASPLARELAGYLAAVPLSLPVMQLVQQVMLPQSRQVHLAEIFRSGLVNLPLSQSGSQTPEKVIFDFHEGVSEELLKTVRRSDTLFVLDKVGEFIQEHRGQLDDFSSVIALPGQEGSVPVSQLGRAFARLSAKTLRRFGFDDASIEVLEQKIINSLTQLPSIAMEETADPANQQQGIEDVWEEIEKAAREGTVIGGRVTDRIKGGLRVDISGIQAFLPGSQVDVRPVRNLDAFRNKDMEFLVLKVNKKRSNIVLSRKALLEAQTIKEKESTLKNLEEGIIVEGQVKNITEYGAFIYLGGLDGLLHITDMSWGRIQNPSELFKVGDNIQVKVLHFDKKRERVSLGYKQLIPDPWDTVNERYALGTHVTGKVVSLTDYGAFLELEPGVEGLAHVSEMSWSKQVKHPSKMLNVGQDVKVVVLGIDLNKRRISLGIKQLPPRSWDTLQERYAIGARVKGKVRNLTDFGAVVEIEEGIDGLVHVSDISWTKRIKHPSEALKKNQEVEVIITAIDTENRRLSLSIKDLEPNAWDRFFEEKKLGDVITGKISRFASFGVFVEIEDGIEGLCHVSELSENHVDKPEDAVQIGQTLQFKILKMDPEAKKIGLSVRAVDTERREYSPLRGKTRIYELARELKLESRRVLEDARRLGVDVSVPSNTISDMVADKIREMYYPKRKLRIYELAKELKYDYRSIIQAARRLGVNVSVPSNVLDHDIANKIREIYSPPKQAISVTPLQPRLIKKSNVTTGTVTLSTFTFTTVTLDARGNHVNNNEIQSPCQLQARQFVEELAPNSQLEMVEIPGGMFQMGAPKEEVDSFDWERPRLKVTVAPFYLGKFTITQAQWRVIAADKLLKVKIDLEPEPSNFKGDDRCPVEQVSWDDAREFCARLAKKTGRAYRLPTEAEWEYACRAETTTPFAFGETITHEIVNYWSENPYAQAPKKKPRNKTMPVGSLGVANAFGLFDMHGNVWEWCEDVWHDSYKDAPGDSTAWTVGGNSDRRVLRGGSWYADGDDCRSTYRNDFAPGDRYDNIGFRVVVAARTV